MLKFKSKNMFNGVTVYNIRNWLESIHKDTLNYGSKEEQYVIELLLHYITKDYMDKKGLENKNIMGY